MPACLGRRAAPTARGMRSLHHLTAPSTPNSPRLLVLQHHPPTPPRPPLPFPPNSLSLPPPLRLARPVQVRHEEAGAVSPSKFSHPFSDSVCHTVAARDPPPAPRGRHQQATCIRGPRPSACGRKCSVPNAVPTD